MGHRTKRNARLSRALLIAALLCSFAHTPAFAQRVNLGGPGAGVNQEMMVTVVVSVRENGGIPIREVPWVKLNSDFSGVHMTAPTRGWRSRDVSARPRG